MIDSLRTMGLGLVSLIIICIVVVGGYNLLALNLGTVTGDYFMGALAVIVLLGGTWLTMQRLGFIGKPFMIAAALVLLTISVRHRAPGIAEFFVQSTKAADRGAQRAAVDIASAREIPCNRTTPKLRFFERETGAPLVWLSETEDGRLICYDRPGHHPQTRNTLVPVDERLAAAILTQPPTVSETPSIAVDRPPIPAIREVSLRDLSQGPIPR